MPDHRAHRHIGGVATPVVAYTAFTGDTVAGLYQMNVQMPSAQNTFKPNFPSATGQFTNLTGPAQLPIFVTLGAVTSQAGVMLSVSPKLKMVESGETFVSQTTTENLTIGQLMTPFVITGSNNAVSTNVKYAVTSGVLPQGLTLTYTSPGGVATIAGTPAQGTAGTYPVTVTATDPSAIPITGNVSFTFYVPGGLYVTSSVPTSSTYNTANAAVATVTAVGGTAPYSLFAVTTPSVAIPGLSLTTGGILQTDGTTPAGTYTIVATATDNAGLTGTVSITFIVKLKVVFSPVSPQTASIATVTNGGLLNTLTVSGGVGPYTYAVDASSTAAAAAAGALNFVGNLLNLGTDTTVSVQSVVIDVVDTGVPVSTAAVDTAISTAGAEFTLSLNLTL
ncbi:MAG: putative Ig domain-containing protein [Bryobacteraceae bacterium]